jgi:hypothetical protein
MENQVVKEKLKKNQKLLALWAADCAEHVLPYFEKKHPRDERPRKAIEAARDWAHGEIRAGQARKAALAAHAAARATEDPSARATARAAGHAAATAHVASHSRGAAIYAASAAGAAAIFEENTWQKNRLKKSLRKIILARHPRIKQIL